MRELFILSLALPLWAQAVTITTSATQPTCTSSNGAIDVFVSGGVPPFAFAWGDGPTTEDRTGLPAGSYTVTVTDANSDTDQETVVLSAQPDLGYFSFSYQIDGQANFPCPGSNNGIAVIPLYPNPLSGWDWPPVGVPPYVVSVSIDGNFTQMGGSDSQGNPWFPGVAVGSLVQIQVSDAEGCVSAPSSDYGYGPEVNGVWVTGTTGACAGGSNGSILFDVAPDFLGWLGLVHVLDDQLNEVQVTEPMESPVIINGLPPGDYTLHYTYGPAPTYVCGPTYFASATVDDLGTDCGTVQGTLFIDNDQDCVQDGTEAVVPYRLLEILPGPEYAITDADGHYLRDLPNGSYTLGVTGTDLLPLCPAVEPVPFTLNTDVVTLDLADSSTVQLDVVLFTGSGAARPGFIHHVHVNAVNHSAQLSGALELTLTFDPQMSYVDATPAPTNVSGNVITWNSAALTAYGQQSCHVQLQVPPDPGLLGLPWSHSASVSQPLAESDLANNATTENGVFTGSYDPNDKTAVTSTQQSAVTYILGQDEFVDYTIRFQNTGTDTAFTVVITDTLDTDLDMGTYVQGVASHPFSVSFKPGRVVEWRFADILLPDSNTNEAASHGLVRFRIRPHAPMVPGTELRNNADIFFDFNPPVRTNDAVLVAETPTGIAAAADAGWQVYPNPSHGAFVVDLGAPHTAADVELHDITGQLVARQPARNTDRVVLHADLAPGIYLLTVRAGDATRTFRVVRN